jgi:hypothetical protein
VQFDNVIQVDGTGDFEWIEENGLKVGWEASFSQSSDIDLSRMVEVEVQTFQ